MIRAVTIEGVADAATLHAIRAAVGVGVRIRVETRPLSWGELVTLVATETGLPRAGILGPSHARPTSWAREALVWAGRELLGLSYPVLGSRIGDRDHTSIMAAFKRATRRRREDHGFRLVTERLAKAHAARCGS